MATLRMRRYVKTLEALIIVVLLTLLAAQYYSSARPGILIIEEHHKMSFETDASFQERLKLQANIKYGSHIKKVGDRVFNEREGYNEAFLDSLPIIRDNIPEFRPTKCLSVEYKRSSTRVSVVMNYHNELISLLLRSVYTVIRAIPPHNFHELILIDDASNLTQHYDLMLVQPLLESLNVPVRYHRFEKNLGLIYSRRFGCQAATGDAVLVLDSHVEVSAGFLEPLLQLTDANYKAIAAPVFDFWETFENKYWSYDGQGLAFDRYLSWITVSSTPSHLPFNTPAIMGGAFLATKRFLEELDYFGRGMEGWGYENLEIGMKTWMCDGTLQYVPCSRVLHYAARRSPMGHGDRIRPKHYLHNAALVVKSFFTDDIYEDFDLTYGVRDDLANYTDAITANKDMLARNKCTKDFRWMRRHLMPEIESFDEETQVANTLVVNNNNICVDLRRTDQKVQELYLQPCPERQSARGRIRLTKKGELRIHDRQCLDWGWKKAQFSGCHGGGGNQLTRYQAGTKRISSVSGTFCLVLYTETGLLDKGPCDSVNDETFTIPEFSFRTVYHPDILNHPDNMQMLK